MTRSNHAQMLTNRCSIANSSAVAVWFVYTTPQPDRTAELEAALKVAKAALNRAADKFHDYAEIHAAKEASPENDLKVERNLMLSSDMDKALAKINEVLHD